MEWHPVLSYCMIRACRDHGAVCSGCLTLGVNLLVLIEVLDRAQSRLDMLTE